MKKLTFINSEALMNFINVSDINYYVYKGLVTYKVSAISILSTNYFLLHLSGDKEAILSLYNQFK